MVKTQLACICLYCRKILNHFFTIIIDPKEHNYVFQCKGGCMFMQIGFDRIIVNHISVSLKCFYLPSNSFVINSFKISKRDLEGVVLKTDFVSCQSLNHWWQVKKNVCLFSSGKALLLLLFSFYSLQRSSYQTEIKEINLPKRRYVNFSAIKCSIVFNVKTLTKLPLKSPVLTGSKPRW